MKNKLIILCATICILLTGCFGITYTETTYIHSEIISKDREQKSQNPITYNYSFSFNIDDDIIDVHVFEYQYKRYNTGDDVNIKVVKYIDENDKINRINYEVID